MDWPHPGFVEPLMIKILLACSVVVAIVWARLSSVVVLDCVEYAASGCVPRIAHHPPTGDGMFAGQSSGKERIKDKDVRYG